MATKVKILTIIANGGAGDKILKHFGKKLNVVSVVHARGTASSNIKDILGLEGSEKDLIFASIKDEDVAEILDVLEKTFHFHKNGKGVAFTVPLNYIAGPVTLKLLAGIENLEDTL